MDTQLMTPESTQDTDHTLTLRAVVQTLMQLPDADVDEQFLRPYTNGTRNNFSQLRIPGDIRIKAFTKTVIDRLTTIDVNEPAFDAISDAVLQEYVWGFRRIGGDRVTAEAMKSAAEGMLRAVVGDMEAVDRRGGEACGRDWHGNVDAMVWFRLVETHVGDAIDRVDWSGGAGERVASMGVDDGSR